MVITRSSSPFLASWFPICLGAATLTSIFTVCLLYNEWYFEYGGNGELHLSKAEEIAEREVLLKGCGEICDTSIGVLENPPDLFYDITKSVDCKALYENTESDAPATQFPPPPRMPSHLKKDFTQGDLIRVGKWYFGKDRVTLNTPKWSTQLIDDYISQALQGRIKMYGSDPLMIQKLLYRHREKLQGKHFFVLGTRVPWLEALLLTAGVSKITTIEYGKIISLDDRIETMTPADVRKRFLETNGTEPKFDGGVSHSSVEHSGLGRYGDRLNPWGDLQAVAKAWCITKPQGFLFLGVEGGTTDFIHWNAARYYGPIRWPQLVANWHFLHDSSVPRFENGLFFQHKYRLQNMFLFSRMDAPNKL